MKAQARVPVNAKLRRGAAVFKQGPGAADKSGSRHRLLRVYGCGESRLAGQRNAGTGASPVPADSGLIKEYGVSANGKMVLREHASYFLEGGAAVVVVHHHLAVAEAGLGLEHAVDALQDCPNPVCGAGSLASGHGQADLGQCAVTSRMRGASSQNQEESEYKGNELSPCHERLLLLRIDPI